MAHLFKASGFFPKVQRTLQAALYTLLLFIVLANLLPAAHSQQTSRAGVVPAQNTAAGGGIHVVIVSPQGKPLGVQAVVKVSNKIQHSVNWQTTAGSETTFTGLASGTYEINASAFGYLGGHTQVEVASGGTPVEVKFVLDRDPSAVSLDVQDAAMPPKASRMMHGGIKALQSGNMKSAEKQLTDADKLAPNNASLKFLLGYAAMQDGAIDQAEDYLKQATTLAPQFARALLLLGRVELVRGQFADAAATLERAVAADPDSWVAHHLLANAYLQQHEFEKSRQEAELAIAKGGQESGIAQFTLGIALAQLGKNSEATAALRSFLQAQPRSSAARDAERWLVLLQQRNPNALIDPLEEINVPSAPAVAAKGPGAPGTPSPNPRTALPLLADIPSPLPPKSLGVAWQPLGVDESAPPVAADTSCPLQEVLERVGERTQDFVDDAGKFAAIETVLDERLDEVGNVSGRETRKFDYTAAFSRMQANTVHVDEYRSQRYDFNQHNDTFVDTGFVALTLVFHPAMRDDFQMRCEGLGSWKGRPVWLIHFQQRDDRPKRMQTFLVNSASYPVTLKGRAWISADTFQVVRIESELVYPLPQIQLLAEHEIAEYAEVSFPSRQVQLWLPKTAEVYLGFRGSRYYRKHSFDHYMLFSVDTDQHVHEVKADDANPKPQNQLPPPN